jgi:hypothetical protein
MKKPILFISMEALLVPGETVEPILRAEIAPFAKAFMHWATQHFQVQLLTERNPREAFHLIDVLGLPEDSVPVKTFLDSKTEAMSHKDNFYWIDSILIPAEVTWLSQHNLTARFKSVEPENGITIEHKNWLTSKL